MKKTALMTVLLAAMLAACTGCAGTETGTASRSLTVNDNTASADAQAETDAQSDAGTPDIAAGEEPVVLQTAFTENSTGILNTAEMFSERDLRQTADLSEAKSLTVSDGETLRITEAGVYILTGSAKNCTVTVDAPDDAKIQLVLDGVSITNSNFPAIYVKSADKVFVTTTASENTLTVSGAFTSDGDTNTDAVIFSKDDLTLNGTGTLKVVSAAGNGITSKDDLVITGGTYDLRTSNHAFEANDLIAVCGGNFTVNTEKDAFHCDNDEGEGNIYLADGSFTLNAGSDGIQATAYLQIDGGSFDITAAEGLESTYVQINGGTCSISASDDGINASAGGNASEIAVEINGGELKIVMAQGDTDGIDANGSIYVNGGTIDITAPCVSFDYDKAAEYNGGTIIINGEQVSEIPEEMMGGRGGFGRRGGFSPQENFGSREDFGGQENAGERGGFRRRGSFGESAGTEDAGDSSSAVKGSRNRNESEFGSANLNNELI